MIIRETQSADHASAMEVQHAAFGSDEIPNLVGDLFEDPSAQPYLSLIAIKDRRAVGHLLFTHARLEGSASANITLLAPLAVIPEAQKQGIGTRLMVHGLEVLAKSRLDLVFVLGHPEYYPRVGFEPAGQLGFQAPYAIPEKNAKAWMVKALRSGILGKMTGTVRCAQALNKPEHWRE